MRGNIIKLLILFTFNSAICGVLSVTHKQVRADKYVFSREDIQWGEAWGELNQFYPRYFKRSSTLQLFIRNNGDKPVAIEKLLFNDVDIQTVCTRADFAGQVIWYRVYPEKPNAGKSSMITIRLRKKLVKPVKISFKSSEGMEYSTIFTPENVEKMRIASVNFELEKSKIYLYVENNSTSNLTIDKVFVNGKAIKPNKKINPNFLNGRPAHLEITSSKKFLHGEPIEILVTSTKGEKAACQIRARGSKINLGIIGNNYTAYHAKMFNMIYRLAGNKGPDAKALEKLNKYKLSLSAPVKVKADMRRLSRAVSPDGFMYGNMDEPDAREPKGLPYMQRCGINIMRKVEPVMKLCRENDPAHLTSLMIDSTYAPLNWFTYGEVPDIYFNDVYCLTKFNGYSMKNVAPRVLTGLYASAPRPVNIMLWGCMNTSFPMRRFHTPTENDMEIHYALGSGAKGIHYFVDWNSFPRIVERGYFIGTVRSKPLWNNIGRMNAKICRISNLLNISYPCNLTWNSAPDELWTRSLICGAENLAVIAVNKKHNVNVADKIKMSHVFPVENAVIKVDIPEWLTPRKLVLIEWDKVTEKPLTVNNGKVEIPVTKLSAGRIWIISGNDKIVDTLQIPSDRLALLKESEKTDIPRSGLSINSFKNDKIIELPADKKFMKLNLTADNIRACCSMVKTEVGSLEEIPGKGIGLYSGQEEIENQSNLIFHFKSPRKLSKLQVKLNCSTPNFVYCANNTLKVYTKKKSVFDRSFKVKWNGRGTLQVDFPEATDDFYVQIIMKDPRIVTIPGYTNISTYLQLSWSDK